MSSVTCLPQKGWSRCVEDQCADLKEVLSKWEGPGRRFHVYVDPKQLTPSRYGVMVPQILPYISVRLSPVTVSSLPVSYPCHTVLLPFHDRTETTHLRCTVFGSDVCVQRPVFSPGPTVRPFVPEIRFLSLVGGFRKLVHALSPERSDLLNRPLRLPPTFTREW